MEVNCPNKAKNLANCPCTAEQCPRKGLCCECVANHMAAGNLPACLKDNK